MTIRGKLTLLVAVSVGASVLLSTVFSVLREGGRDAALQSERLNAAAAVLASSAADAVHARSQTQAFKAIRSVAMMPEVTYARVELPDGSLLAETGAGVRLISDAQVGGGQSNRFMGLLRSHTIEASSLVRRSDGVVGRVVILGKAQGVADRLLTSLVLSLGAGLAAGLFGLLIALRLQRSISGPIASLTRSMDDVERSLDYSKEAELQSNDEIGDLVRGFNRMMAEIRVRDAEIANQVHGLERTVAQRTADLETAKDAAEAANSAKSDFLATMSHEIRTPMNGIMVMAEMLAAGDLAPRPRRFAEVIAKSGSSLLAIINDILDFSKIEAGKLDLDPQPVDPDDIVDDVLSLFWERARSKGLDLAAFVDPSIPACIRADEVRLRQVLGNLINNALKFTEVGGVLVQVTRGTAERLTFSVHDTGIGIPADKIGSLFGAFTQADQSTTRRFGGTGLGLAISKRLVSAMGGTFDVRSTVGRGSVFAFSIPVEALEPALEWPALPCGHGEVTLDGAATRRTLGAYLNRAGLSAGRNEADMPTAVLIGSPEVLRETPRDGAPRICVAAYAEAINGEPAALDADAVLVQPVRRRDLRGLLMQLAAGERLQSIEAPAAARHAVHDLPSFSGYRVLIADDSAVNREVAMAALSRLGVQTDTVNDGREALDAVMRGGFDLVLMDGSMPEMDGYEATRAIRRHEAETGLPALPIIALTAHVVGAAAEAWREAGMDAVLYKPFTLAALAARLGQFLEPVSGAILLQDLSDAPEPRLSESGADRADLIDPTIAQELAEMASDGKADFVERVIGLYRDNAPASLAGLQAAFEAGDVTAVARAAHALKSMSLNIGARKVAELCARLESEARDQSLLDRTLVADLEQALPATLGALGGRPALSDAPVAVMAPAGGFSAAEVSLLQQMEAALRDDLFHLVYQPQTGPDGASVIGVECLIRWPGAPNGIGPDIFIPLAERSGLIKRLTPWVIDRALDEMSAYPSLPVAFNASAIDICDGGFPEVLAKIIDRHGFDPRRLEVEITETAILHSTDQVRAAVDALHDMGVKVALDDFGSGYSSLSHLRLVPFDKLKIDKGFINGCTQDVKSAAVVHAVVSMGRALGMKVVAEGVETELQHRFLKVAGVHCMQGYLFGKPIPAAELNLVGRQPLAQIA